MNQESIFNCGAECFIFLPLAVLPSILWLAVFVFSKRHRENFSNIKYIFMWGVFSAIPVVLTELFMQEVFFKPFAAAALTPLLLGFLGVAFIEESAKYLVVRFKAMGKSFFDEPQDAVVYMAASALGFAAIENVAYAMGAGGTLSVMLQNIALRGVTAVFLHVSASGALGYFLALSIMHKNQQRKFLYTGVVLATLLHGIYNNFIMNIEGSIRSADTASGLFDTAMAALTLIISGAVLFAIFWRMAALKFTTRSNTSK